jgi:hypothetical protein
MMSAAVRGRKASAVVVGYNGRVTRSFAPVLVVTAAFVVGLAGVLAYGAVTGDLVRALLGLAVAAVGAGVALLPDADDVVRAVGTSGIVVGALAFPEPVRGLLVTLVLLGLALTGTRMWLSGAGVAAAMTGVVPDGVLVAGVLAVVVVAAPARAWWGDLAGALAGALIVAQHSLAAAAIAAVLLMTAVVRRDLVTGLLAAAVFAVPAAVHAWPLGVIVVVALVAIRVPGVRAVVTRVPALRGTRTADAVAGAAVVAAGGLVGMALQLPLWWLVLLTVLLAGALGHWLPQPAGPALAVVAMVGLGIARPFPVLDLVLLLGAVPLLRRHPTPAVFAAAAFLVLRVVPWVPSVVTFLVVGVVAAVLAFGWKTAPVGQAMGAVVLGLVAVGQTDLVLLVLVFVLGASVGWRLSWPLLVAASLALYRLLAHVEVGWAVVLALGVSAAALVVAAFFAARCHGRAPRLVHGA